MLHFDHSSTVSKIKPVWISTKSKQCFILMCCLNCEPCLLTVPLKLLFYFFKQKGKLETSDLPSCPLESVVLLSWLLLIYEHGMQVSSLRFTFFFFLPQFPINQWLCTFLIPPLFIPFIPNLHSDT